MRKIRYLFFSFIFLICSFLPCLSVYAQGDSWTNAQKQQFFAEGFYKIVTDICGLILPTGLGGNDLQRDYQNYVLNNDWIQDNLTYDEWIGSQINIVYKDGSSGDADISYSANIQNSIREWAQDYIENDTGFLYAYSINASSFLSKYSNQDDYHNFLDKVSENDSKLKWVMTNANGQVTFLITCDLDNVNLVRISKQMNALYSSPYLNWSLLPDSSITYYIYNFSTHSWGPAQSGSISKNLLLRLSPDVDITDVTSYYKVIDTNTKQYIVYNSTSALQSASEGVQPYYVTDSFNTNTVNDSYNTTTYATNNTITYGDVQNYVNNSYITNNSYPTSNDVYNYINNYVPPENNGGDNGGGNGGDFDWSFLGTIGDFLGGLLQGLGNALSGILSLLTDIIDMFIGEDGLPNTISQLLGYFLNDFLPPEFLQLIELSIVLMVIVGVIKLIRG